MTKYQNMKIISLLLICTLLCGCSSRGRVRRLLTLKEIADEQEDLAAYVQKQNNSFEKLLKVVQSDQMHLYSNQEDILNEFGDPVFKRQIMRKGVKVTQWVYRYATQYFNAEKVYIYFDSQGQLLDWEHVVPKET